MNKKELYCYGCGAKLQTENENMEGYIQKSVLEKAEKRPLCKRCHNIRNHNIRMEAPLMNEDFIKILKEADSRENLIVYVLDIFNFKTSMIDEITKYMKNNNFLVVLNKLDLLPKSIKTKKLIDYAISHLNLGDRVLDVIVTSATKKYNIDELLEKINKYRNGKDVYFVGTANVGKSSLINEILKNYKNTSDHLITISAFPGTTLRTIQIPLDNYSYIFDTPGIIDNNCIWNAVDDRILKYILPKKEIKPVSFQIYSNQSIYFGGLGRMDVTVNKRVSATFYMSNLITLHRTKTEKADEKYEALIQDKNFQPLSNNLLSIDNFEKHVIHIGDKPKCDVVINGLGFITLRGFANLDITFLLPPDVNVSVEDSMI